MPPAAPEPTAIPWEFVLPLLAFAANWGMIRATVGAFRKEVDELKKVLEAFTSISGRVLVLESRMSQADQERAEMRAELVRQHTAHRALVEDARQDAIETMRRDLDLALTRTPPVR